MRKPPFRLLITCLLSGLIFVSPAWPWGNEGHRVIAVNAVRLLPKELLPLFEKHTEPFSYYANVPDTAWRSNETKAAEKPTHFLNSENFSLSPEHPSFPTDPQEARKLFRAPADRPQTTFVENGISPWRVRQLYRMLVTDFEKAAQGGAAGAQHAEMAGAHAGILSHYVADAVMPFHATYDYDGRNAGHGGIHSYLETDVVKVLERDGSLSAQSLKLAQKNSARYNRMLKPGDPARTTITLLMDSYRKIDPVYKIDTRHALIKKSAAFALKKMPRVPAEKSAGYFASVIAERMALGSTAVSALIQSAWEAAGKPNLKSIFGRGLVKLPYIAPIL